MNVTAPPRPPRPRNPVDRDEFEALIQEARRRALRRRRAYAAVGVVIALVGIGVFTAYARTTQSSPSPSLTPRPALAAKAASSQIAFMRDPAGVGQAHKELYVMNADGSGQRLLARGNRVGRDGLVA